MFHNKFYIYIHIGINIKYYFSVDGSFSAMYTIQQTYVFLKVKMFLFFFSFSSREK